MHAALVILDRMVRAGCQLNGPMTAKAWQNAIVDVLPNVTEEALAPVAISVSCGSI